MDPLSVASGVAGLVTLAEVVISRAYNTIIACKHASQDSRRLLREVQALAGILHSLAALENKLGAATLLSQITAPQVLECQKTLQCIRDKLEKADPKEQGISFVQKAKRTLKWPLSASDTEEFLVEMERHKSSFDLALSVDALDTMLEFKAAEQETSNKIDQANRAIEMLCKIQTTKESRRLLQAVGADDADEMYRTNLELHQPGTCMWFLGVGSTFRNWLDSTGTKVWVYGIPGAGKTVLSALTIEETAKSVGVTHGVAFFFFSHASGNAQRPSNLLACIIGQLARQHQECLIILEEKARHSEGTTDKTWLRNNEELLNVLRQMIRLFSKMSIIVDGIDECDEATEVTELLVTLAAQFSHVRLLLFSRKEAQIEPFFDSFDKLSVATESQDLRLYVPAQIERRTRLGKLRIRDSDVKDVIVEKLVNGADGMFRWVACQLDHLCNLTSDRERIEALGQLPRTLEATYDRILERVNERSESACVRVERTLRWLSQPLGVLGSQQLCEAISIELGSTSLDSLDLVDVQDILIYCGSLVRLSADGNFVEFAHFTVGEYLRGIDPVRKPHLLRYRWDSTPANIYKAEVCLTALNFSNNNSTLIDNMQSLLEQLARFPFLLHAAEAWASYAGPGQHLESLQVLTRQLFCDLQRRSNFANWRHLFVLSKGPSIGKALQRLVCHNRPTRPGAVESSAASSEEWSDYQTEWIIAQSVGQNSSELHFAAMFHLTYLFKSLAIPPSRINAQSSLGTPLHCAFLRDLSSICAWHISRDDMIREIRDRIPEKKDPSNLAANLLLGLGADLKLPFRPFEGMGLTTASIAYCVDELNIVINAGAVLDQSTAEFILKHYRPKDNYECLRNVDIDQVAESDRFAVARLLRRVFDKADNLNAIMPAILPTTHFKDKNDELVPEYRVALVNACKHDDLEILQWILEGAGIDIDHMFEGATFLHKASAMSSPTIAAYLVSKGALVDKRDSSGITALANVLRNRNFTKRSLRVLNLLLAAKASTKHIGQDNATSLMLWAELKPHLIHDPESKENKRFSEALKALLAHGASPLHQDTAQRCCWHSLANNYFSGAQAKLLLQHLDETAIRSSIDLPDANGMTPLHNAANFCHAELMELLIDQKVNYNATNIQGRTVLSFATGALARMSHDAFKLAIGLDWRAVDIKADCTTALIHFSEWITDPRDLHDDNLSSAAPDRLRQALSDLVRLSSVSEASEIIDVACIENLVKWFADDGHHDLQECGPCSIRLECFVIFLQAKHKHRELVEADWSRLGTLAHGLELNFRSRPYQVTGGDSACTMAICELLRIPMCSDLLKTLFTNASFLSLVTRLRNEELLGALLDTGVDVDNPLSDDDTKMGTLLQLFCYHAAPPCILEKALKRTQKLNVRYNLGHTLSFAPFYSYEAQTTTLFELEATVRLLVKAGIDVNIPCASDGTTALMYSAQLPSSKTLQLLLQNGADVSLTNDYGKNALAWASVKGCRTTVEILIAHGCPFLYPLQSLPHPLKVTLPLGPFQAAALAGSLEALETLHEASQSERDVERKLGVPSALWLASTQPRSLERVRFLTEKGFDVNGVGPEEGQTPLHAAARCGCLETVEFLLHAGSRPAKVDHSGLTAESQAMMNGHIEIAELLANHSANTDDSDSDSKRIQTDSRRPGPSSHTVSEDTLPDVLRDRIIETKSLTLLEKLTSAGTDLRLRFRSCQCSPMMVALADGECAVVTFLQSLGVPLEMRICDEHFPEKLSAYGLLAAQKDMIAPLRQAVRSSLALPLQTLECMLHSATSAGNVAAMQIILDLFPSLPRKFSERQYIKADFHLLGPDGWKVYARSSGAALHTAIPGEKIQSIELLLKYGFDPDGQNSLGQAPMHTAARLGRLESLDCLLAHGADINVRSRDLETPLILAAGKGEIETVRHLMEHGADVKAVDMQGDNALRAAAWGGHYDVFVEMLNAGLEPSGLDIRYMYSDYTSVLMLAECRRAIEQIELPLCCSSITQPLRMRSLLRYVPPQLRKLGFAQNHQSRTMMYRAAIAGAVDMLEVLHQAGAMLNLEGGPNSTPLMGACKYGRLDVVKFLVRNGALLRYQTAEKRRVSAFVEASNYPGIQRWLLVERFTEQRVIAIGLASDIQNKAHSSIQGLPKDYLDLGEVQANDVGRTPIQGVPADYLSLQEAADDTAGYGPELVLEGDVEKYLESKNWFLPRRRFVDRGDGTFDQKAIDPSDFAKSRPEGFRLSVE